MQTRGKLDKIAYIMLTISGIIALLCILVLMGFAVYVFVEALGDSNGGGWLLFLLMIGGIVFIPAFTSWGAQVVLYVLGILRYRKGNFNMARIFGITNSIVTILGDIYLLGVLSIGQSWSIELIMVFLVMGVSMVYMLVLMILLIVSKNKAKTQIYI